MSTKAISRSSRRCTRFGGANERIVGPGPPAVRRPQIARVRGRVVIQLKKTRENAAGKITEGDRCRGRYPVETFRCG